MMKSIATIFLVIHIISGFAALITGFISMLNRKGGKRHRLTGKIFFTAMTGVFISATIVALIKGLVFLFMVGFFSYYLACSGYRILSLKKLHLSQKPAWIDWIVNGIGILAGSSLMVFSIHWFQTRGAWGTVPLAFGLFCTLSGLQDMRNFFIPPPNKLHWLFTHGIRMGGSFAATLTAFTVVNVNIGNLTWTLWILPGILTGIWIGRILRPYKTHLPAL